MNHDLSFQQRSLFQQGYQHYTSDELRQMQWGLRFTPTACTTMTVIALIYQLPWLAYLVSCLGLLAFLLPSAHPMDLIYNHLVRKPFKAIALPANPLQRRLACLSAGVLNFFVGTFFLLGWTSLALAIGAMLVVLQVIVITTHFCFLSWIYELFMRALHKWQLPLSPEEAGEHINKAHCLLMCAAPSSFLKLTCPMPSIFPSMISTFKANSCAAKPFCFIAPAVCAAKLPWANCNGLNSLRFTMPAK